MTCPNCNREISEESSFCPHCMAKLKRNLTPFEKYDRVMQKHLSGLIFLALTVAATILNVVFLFNMLDALKHSMLSLIFASVPFIVSTITTVGLWITWIKAKGGVVRIREQKGKIMCLSSFYYIMAYVLCIGVIIIGLLSIYLVSSVGSLVNDFIDFAELFENANIKNSGKILRMLTENTVVVLFVMLVAIVAAFVIFIMKYNAFRRIMDHISNGYVSERVPHYYSNFYSIASYAYALVFCVIAFMFSSEIFSILQNLMYAVMSALSGVLFAVSRREIYDCYIEEQREIVGN